MTCSSKIKNFSKKFNKVSGFTITEMLVVLFIMGVLAGSTLPNFNTFNRRQKIKQGVKKLKTDIRTAQGRSVTGYNYSSPSSPDDKPDAWGVRIAANSNSYEMFSCQSSNEERNYCYTSSCDGSYQCTNQSKKILVLPENVVITDLTPVSPVSIVFDVVTGEVFFKNDDGTAATSGPVVVKVNWPGWSSDEEREVRITRGGNIEDVKR